MLQVTEVSTSDDVDSLLKPEGLCCKLESLESIVPVKIKGELRNLPTTVRSKALKR